MEMRLLRIPACLHSWLTFGIGWITIILKVKWLKSLSNRCRRHIFSSCRMLQPKSTLWKKMQQSLTVHGFSRYSDINFNSFNFLCIYFFNKIQQVPHTTLDALKCLLKYTMSYLASITKEQVYLAIGIVIIISAVSLFTYFTMNSIGNEGSEKYYSIGWWWELLQYKLVNISITLCFINLTSS